MDKYKLIDASASSLSGLLISIGGVALQERDGEAVLLAVGFEVRGVAPKGETDLTVVEMVGNQRPVTHGTRAVDLVTRDAVPP